MNEIELRKKFEALVPHETIERYKKAYEDNVKFKALDSELRAIAESFLAEEGLAEYTEDGMTFVAVPSYEKKTVDTQKMKDEGIYELYTKNTIVKPSIRINIEYEDD